MRPLEFILLVDDSESDNFFHQNVIQDSGLALSIEAKYDPVDALTYIKQAPQKPELILLDLNMPTMTGWQFLEALSETLQAEDFPTVVLMLGTALPRSLMTKAEQHKLITDIVYKPLTIQAFAELVTQHFASG